MQFAFAVFYAVALQLRCACLVLPENLHEGAWAQPERCSSGFRVAAFLRHNVKNMRDEQRKLRVARLDMPVAARKFHLDFGGRFTDIQCKSHLHAVQCVNFVLFRASAF